MVKKMEMVFFMQVVELKDTKVILKIIIFMEMGNYFMIMEKFNMMENLIKVFYQKKEFIMIMQITGKKQKF
jgi:hypothetical protein